VSILRQIFPKGTKRRKESNFPQYFHFFGQFHFNRGECPQNGKKEQILKIDFKQFGNSTFLINAQFEKI
jgi:hypothetical protein